MPVLRSMRPSLRAPPPPRPAPRVQAGGRAVLPTPSMPLDGLPMGSGNLISAGERWRHPDYRTCTRLTLAPMASAIYLLAIPPSAFRRTNQAALDSSSFAMARTLRPPICRHFCSAWGMPLHTAMSALAHPRPRPDALRREGGRRRLPRSSRACSRPPPALSSLAPGQITALGRAYLGARMHPSLRPRPPPSFPPGCAPATLVVGSMRSCGGMRGGGGVYF